MRDRSAAEDVAAEVFLRLLNNIERYEYRGVPLQADLFRIARNLVVDQQRRIGRTAPLEAIPIQRTLSVNPQQIAEQHLSWAEMQSALESLTEEQREVVLLKFVEGMDNRQVADVVGKKGGLGQVVAAPCARVVEACPGASQQCPLTTHASTT